MWCKLSTNKPDRWTLVGIISDGTEVCDPDVAGLGHGPSVLNGSDEIVTTGFALKDGGILPAMQNYCLINLDWLFIWGLLCVRV